MTRWLFAFLLLLTGMAAAASNAQGVTGPSFSCAGARDVTAAICADAGLSDEDRRLTALYAFARKDVFGLGASGMVDNQRQWLKALNTDCGATAFARQAKTQRDCIANQYEGRILVLAETAIIVAPDIALPEIRRYAPDDAAIYQAIYLYATIDDARVRATRVAAVLAPVYATFDGDVTSGFSEMSGPVNAQAAAASDEAFGLFVALADARAGHGVDWPCAALVKRPGLIAATGSLYGSSTDNGVPGGDCRIMAPAVPDFTNFVDLALRSSPDCDGSIRYAGYRNYGRLETAALLYSKANWIKEDDGVVDVSETAFRSKRGAEMNRAIAALAGYYGRVFRLSDQTAGADAKKITDLLTHRAFTVCDG